LTQSFRPHYGPGVDSALNRNEYQECFLEGKGGRCIGLTTWPPSCADFLEIWEPKSPGTLRGCNILAQALLFLLHNWGCTLSCTWPVLKKNVRLVINPFGYWDTWYRLTFMSRPEWNWV